MRVTYRGNFRVPFSTECDIAAAMTELGCDVYALQEDEVDWPETVDACRHADAFVWTQTYDFAHRWSANMADAALDFLRPRMPTIGVHLDKWWGLSRQHQVAEEAFFRLGWVFTADGDHDEDWRAAGVNHVWSPPAVNGAFCYRGTPRPDFDADVAFVGSWDFYGHPEHWPVRRAMLDHLAARYGERFRCWPQEGQPVRQGALNDLAASVKVMINDSCLAATSRAYFSDRVFELTGRGACVVSPWIPELAGMLVDGVDVVYFPPGDWDAMGEVVDRLLAHPDERERLREHGLATVTAGHTYAHRMRAIFQTVGLAVSEAA